MDLNEEIAGGFSAHLHITLGGGGLQDQGIGETLCDRLEVGPGGAAAHLFIGIEEHADGAVQAAGGQHGLHSPDACHDAILHIIDTGAGELVAFPLQGQVINVPNGVEVANHQCLGTAFTNLIVQVAATGFLGIFGHRVKAKPLLHQGNNGIGTLIHIILLDGGALVLDQHDGIGDDLLAVFQQILLHGFLTVHR